MLGSTRGSTDSLCANQKETRYRRHLAGRWRAAYVIAAMLSLYFNVFVLIVQLFLKIPALHALAPTQTGPAFKFSQLAVLVLFIALTILAILRFRIAQPDLSPMPLQVA